MNTNRLFGVSITTNKNNDTKMMEETASTSKSSSSSKKVFDWEHPTYNNNPTSTSSGINYKNDRKDVGSSFSVASQVLTEFAHGWIRPKLLLIGFLPSISVFFFLPIMMILYSIWNILCGGYIMTSIILTATFIWKLSSQSTQSISFLPFLRIFLLVCLSCRFILPKTTTTTGVLSLLYSWYNPYCIRLTFAMLIASMAVASTYIGTFSIAKFHSYPVIVKQKRKMIFFWLEEPFISLLMIYAMAGFACSNIIWMNSSSIIISLTCILTSCTTLFILLNHTKKNDTLLFSSFQQQQQQQQIQTQQQTLPYYSKLWIVLLIPIIINMMVSSSSSFLELGISYGMTIGLTAYYLFMHSIMKWTCLKLTTSMNFNIVPPDVMIQSILVGFGPSIVQQMILPSKSSSKDDDNDELQRHKTITLPTIFEDTLSLEQDLLRFTILSSLHYNDIESINDATTTTTTTFQPIIRSLCTYCGGFANSLKSNYSPSQQEEELKVSLTSCKAVEYAIQAIARLIIFEKNNGRLFIPLLFHLAHDITCTVYQYSSYIKNKNNHNFMMTCEHYIAYQRQNDLRCILLACETSVITILQHLQSINDVDFYVQKYTTDLSKDCSAWIHQLLSQQQKL